MRKLETRLHTHFHLALATNEWLQSLCAYVEEALHNQSKYQTCKGEGVASTIYNEPRYMGPSSVVKFYFDVQVTVAREIPSIGGTDT